MYYNKLEGTRNTSDILTKVVEKDVIDKHMSALGLEFREGRNSITPAYTKLQEDEALDGHGMVTGEDGAVVPDADAC